MTFSLGDFLLESNRIEGIHGITVTEMDAADAFLRLPTLTVANLSAYVAVIQPGAILRNRRGLNVIVGKYRPLPGGPEIRKRLDALLRNVSSRKAMPWDAHVAYETLHPFTDGNGRSGRMVWLWLRHGEAPLGFLHHFYYETLQNTGDRERI